MKGLVEDVGFEAIDAGGLASARYLESDHHAVDHDEPHARPRFRVQGATRVKVNDWMRTSGVGASSSVAVTYDPKNSRGVNNRGRYSNPELDELVNTAFQTLDDGKRRALLEKASEISMDDAVVLPLYFFSFSIATPKNIGYAPRLDQFTFSQNARKLN